MTHQWLQGARNIGDHLLAIACNGSHGPYWKNLRLESDLSFSHEISESLYSGNAGLIHFFQSLYEHTKEDVYAETAVQAAVQLLDWMTRHPCQRLGYFQGRLGALTTIMKTKDLPCCNHFQQALELAKSCAAIPLSHIRSDDFAEILLGWLHLHELTGENYFMQKIEEVTEVLLHQARPGPQGLYWNPTGGHISGLCGFLHGASGVAFAFLELARYLDNPAFYHIAFQAFDYEDYWYNPAWGGWGDLRLGGHASAMDEHLGRLHSKDVAYFNTPRATNAWCHGSVGIGLARLRAFEYTGHQPFKEDVVKALSFHPDVATSTSFNLCHGLCGNLELFLQASALQGLEDLEQELITQAARVVDAASEPEGLLSGYRKNNRFFGEDPSLFLGQAGVGLFLLRMVDSQKTPPVMTPRLSQICQTPPTTGVLALTEAGLRRLLADKKYPRTLAFVDEHLPELTTALFKSNRPVASFIEKARPFLDNNHSATLSGLFHLETRVDHLQRTAPSHVLLFIKEKQWQAPLLKDLMPSILVLDPQTEVVETKTSVSTNQPAHFMLRVIIGGVQQTEIQPLVAAILQQFKKPKVVSEGIEDILSGMALDDEDQRKQARKIILQQIHQLTAIPVLLCPDLAQRVTVNKHSEVNTVLEVTDPPRQAVTGLR